VIIFPTENILKLSQNHFILALPFFCSIVLRSKVDHMWLIVVEEQAFLSRSVSFDGLFCAVFSG